MNTASSVRPLPARVVPLAGESLVSLIRRTAAVMGYKGPRELLALLADCGKVQANVSLLRPGPALEWLAALLRQTPERLLGLTVHRFASTLMLDHNDASRTTLCDSKTALRYFARGTFPICPECLRQDATTYERLSWSLYALPVCIEHRCWLVYRCPSCNRSLRSERPALSVCRCGKSLANVKPVSLTDAVIGPAVLLERLFLQGASCLPDMSVAAMCWWTERLATAAARAPAWIQHTGELLQLNADAPTGSVVWLAAGEMIRRWPGCFYDFLDVFQQVPKHRQTSTGVTRRFGLLLREAGRLEDLGFPTPAQTLRQYLLERYTGGHLTRKIGLFQKPKDRTLLRDRSWISQTEAAKILQVRQGAISEFVSQGILTGQIHPSGTNGRSVGLVQRDSVETLRRDLQSAVSVPSAARRTGLGIRAIRDLIHDGVLPGPIRTHRGWRIPDRSLSALEAIFHSAKPIKALGTRWISLREASRTFGPTGLNLSQLLALIRDGKVTARLADPDRLLHGLVVAKDTLETLVPELRLRQQERHGCPVHRLGKTLFPGRPVEVGVVKRWIDAGLLEVQQLDRARVASQDEILRFRATYCLRKEAIRILGITSSTLKIWQDAGRILPIFPKPITPHAGLYLYRRVDLELLRSTQHRRNAA